MTLNAVMALFCVISPNSVASGAHCVKVYVYDVVVKSSRSLFHLLMSFFSILCPFSLISCFGFVRLITRAISIAKRKHVCQSSDFK